MSRFDIGKFKPPPDDEFICGICKNVLDYPKESPCRHVFCKACIIRALQEKSKCPICRTSVRERHLKDVLPLVQNLLNKLPMECDFYDNGCETSIPMERYMKHLSECEFMKVVCNNSSCFEILLKRDLEKHQSQTCKFRTVPCDKGCKTLVPFTEVVSHNCLETLLKINSELKEKNEALTKKLEELKSMVLASGSHRSSDKDNGEEIDDEADSHSHGSEVSYHDSGARSIFMNYLTNSNDSHSYAMSETFSNSSIASPTISEDYRGDEEELEDWGSDRGQNFDEEDSLSTRPTDYDFVNPFDRNEPEVDHLVNFVTVESSPNPSDTDSHLQNLFAEDIRQLNRQRENDNGGVTSFNELILNAIEAGPNVEGSRKRPGGSGNEPDSPSSNRNKRIRLGIDISEGSSSHVNESHNPACGSSSSSGSVRRSARLQNNAVATSAVDIDNDKMLMLLSSYPLHYPNEDSSSSDNSWICAQQNA